MQPAGEAFDPAATSEPRLGDRVLLGGREYVLLGFSPMSVEPAVALLESVAGGGQVVLPVGALRQARAVNGRRARRRTARYLGNFSRRGANGGSWSIRADG